MKGFFITFEGGEGAGKSTQVQRLKARLEEAGYRVVSTREPGGTPRAEEIRASILNGEAKPYGSFAEALMFSAARRDHLQKKIRPALRDGAVVICDRFADSTRAYQGAVGEVDPALLAALEGAVVGETRPNLTLILDLPAEIGLSRAALRRQGSDAAVDRFEQEDIMFHKRLRDGFKAIAQAEPDRCVVIAADRSADDVEREIWGVVSARLGVKQPAAADQAAGEG